jgi:polyisoprenyl-phosphate glycosyltransferase
MALREKYEISVVVPVYGCAGCLLELHNRLKRVLSSLTSRYEIIYVEDQSPDGAWPLLSRIALKDRRVKALKLSRNFGQHAAITAGLSKAEGKWTFVMDCDLQDPPEEIPRLYRKALEGFDIVLTKRKRKKFSFFRKITAHLYFSLLNLFTREKLEGDYGSFSLLSAKVRRAFLRLNDNDRHYLFIVRWLGFPTASLEYEHGQRFHGKSSYSLTALLVHAFNGIFFQTTVLLRWIVYLGLVVSLLGWILAFYFIYLYYFRSIPPGWTSLSVLILITGGFILMGTGVAGLYVGKIFDQVKGRPLFVVEKEITGGRNRE